MLFAKGLDQPIQKAQHLIDRLSQRLMLVGIQVREIASDFELSIEFKKRTAGLSEEMQELAAGKPSLPFGYVRCYGNSRSPNLGSQPEGLSFRKSLSCLVCMDSQRFSFLPDNQFTVGSRHS